MQIKKERKRTYRYSYTQLVAIKPAKAPGQDSIGTGGQNSIGANNFGKYGDFSYGVYILHFPIIQVFLQMGWFGESPWYFLNAVILAVSVSAVAMWHLVEKRYLLRQSHYIITTSPFSKIAA
ncbi:MAG: hypothetical protein EXR36_00235 [Betaproteobacteria bacterium]|nr:hypothetical protein [Betaproteobacteria bacterium]